MDINIKSVGYFDGQTVNKKGDIVFKLLFSYDERESMAQFMALVGQIIKLYAEISGNKPKFVGEFSYEGLLIDKNGQGHLKLSTEHECLNHGVVEDLLPNRNSEQPTIVIFTFSSSVILEDDTIEAPVVEDEWEDVETVENVEIIDDWGTEETLETPKEDNEVWDD